MNVLGLKPTLWLVSLIIFFCFSCSQEESIPVYLDNATSAELLERNLEYLAQESRNHGKAFNDKQFVLAASQQFIRENFSSEVSKLALTVFSSVSNPTFEGNLGNENQYAPEILDLLGEISLINDESNSLEDYLSKLSVLQEEFAELDISEEVKFEGLANIEINAALAEFYSSNGDLFVNEDGSIANQSEGVEGWWSKAKAYLKCAAGVIGGGLTGAVGGCGIGAGVGVAIGGPVGAGAGCAIGALLGGVGGALTGAVASGCFEL